MTALAAPGEAPPTHLPGGYRPHLDGLRGVAILGVLLFHYRVPGFSGGFVGVDIFFVISGYLISRILVAEVEGGNFSTAAFYERRVRRLLPALLLMVAFVLAAGWLAMMPRAYEGLGASAAATMAGASNLYFWYATATYFRPIAETLPLLHAWSLGVEEQFYLAFPLFLAFFLRRGRRSAAIAMALAFVASLLLAEWLVRSAPTPAFYFPGSRAWELLTGALLALHLERSGTEPGLGKGLAPAAGLAGLAMMAAAITGFGPGTGVPGIAALLPCGGAALAIWAGAVVETNPAARLLEWRPLVWTGLLSYSLYLWHWPLLVLLRHHLFADPPGAGSTLAAAALTVAAACLSFYFVELPIRRRRFLKRRRTLFVSAAASALLLLAAGIAIYRAHGIGSRFPGFAPFALSGPSIGKPRPCTALRLGRDPDCLPKGARPSIPRVLLWGDSYAGHYASAFRALKDRLPFAVAAEWQGGCLPVLGFDVNRRPECRRYQERIPALAARAGIDVVIISGRWDGQEDRLPLAGLAGTIRRFRAQGVDVILFGQSPVFAFDETDEYHYRRVRAGAPPDEGFAPDIVRPELNARLRSLARETGAYYFDPVPALCERGICAYREHGRYLFGSTSHLTEEGSLEALRLFLKSPDYGLEGRLWRERSRGSD